MNKCTYKGCGKTEGLIVLSRRKKAGEEVVDYICAECNRKRANDYYHRNKERVMMNNLRSLAKRFNFKLVPNE